MNESGKAIAVTGNGSDFNSEKTKALWAGAGNTALSADVVRALALVGDHYQLDPALGEVMILGNKVYITLEGYLRVAEQHPAYDGYELWPLSVDERKAMRVGENEDAFGCRVWRKDRRFPSVGYGVASVKTVQMSSMQVYTREVAEKRAIHRAHRMAFRVRLPDAEDAMQQYQQTGTVGLPIIEQGEYREREPAALPSPDWKSFWTHVKGLGVEHEEVHHVLNVQSVTEWQGSLEEAIQLVEQYVLTRDQRKAATDVTTPTPAETVATVATPAPAGKFDRPRAEKRYIALIDKAEVLGVTVTPFSANWTDNELRAHGRKLADEIATAETALEKRAEAAKGVSAAK